MFAPGNSKFTVVALLTDILNIFPITVDGRNDDNIIEIDGTAPPSPKIPKIVAEKSDESASAVTAFKQPPVLATIYNDPDTKRDICLVVVMFFTGAKKSISTYIRSMTWPKSSYTCEDMFTRDAARSIISKLDPKYVAIEKVLESFRSNMEDAPLGTIDIKLPSAVLLDPSTWRNYNNKKQDGTLLVFWEFMCARSEYAIKKSEKSIILD